MKRIRFLYVLIIIAGVNLIMRLSGVVLSLI